MKYLYLAVLVVLGSCVFRGQPKTIEAPTNPPTVKITPITPEAFDNLDVDKDGALSEEELKNLPTEKDSSYVWVFITIVASVVIVVVVTQVFCAVCGKHKHKELKKEEEEIKKSKEELLEE